MNTQSVPFQILISALFLLWALLSVIACAAAYRNGVNDGYGFSQEPWNPGYRKAGNYLRKHCRMRWRVPPEEIEFSPGTADKGRR